MSSPQTRIQKIILINWKGMFFQPFDIDPSMTILEGANGTGKTTIMIAAYTCLIPDLNFLNFQNVTSVSSRRNEDKGLYGRIGQDDRNKDEPIFSLLDVLTSKGRRHLIGVQLIKKTYPQVSLKHFAISNLSHDADIEKLLIKYDAETNQQEIPELSEISAKSNEIGAELINFKHAKEYFRYLFENDISPIRLIEHEERRKYNQLLHTSLYGGLSRSLQTSLRDYLLPDNDKLIKGIQEMEQNLLTCRKTRSAISRYQSVREVIQKVFQNGYDMFSSAFFATRLEAEQKIQFALNQRGAKKQLKNEWEKLAKQIAFLAEQQKTEEEQLRQILQDSEQTKEELSRCQTAQRISKEIENKQSELEKQKEILVVSENKNREIDAKTSKVRDEERNLASQQLEIAKQLSDAGQAWQELSKQVGLFHQAENLMRETKELLQTDELEVDEIDKLLLNAKARHESLKLEHQEIYLQWNDAKLKHDHFQEYFQLLEEITEESIDQEKAGEKAKQVLEEYFQLENKLRKAEELPQKIGQLREKSKHRNQLIKSLTDAGLDDIDNAETFEKRREETLQQIKDSRLKLKDIDFSIELKEKEIKRLTEKIPELEEKQKNWESFQYNKSKLEDRIADTISNTIEFATHQNRIDESVQSLTIEKHEIIAHQKQVQNQYNTLLKEQTNQSGLKSLVDQGFGKLFSEKFEDIPLDWAANLESRLGPLANALVVKDIHKTANELIGSFDRPDDLWLVEESMKEKMPEAVEITDSILVKHGDAWRLSRLSESPILGKDARAAMLEKLATEIKELAKRLENIDKEILVYKENQQLVSKIRSFENPFNSTPPSEELNRLREDKPGLNDELEKLKLSSERFQSQLEEFENKDDLLRQFFPQKHLLNENNLEDQLKTIEQDYDDIQQLELANQKKLPLFQKLQQGVQILDFPASENLDSLQASEALAQKEEERARQAVASLDRLSEIKEHFQYSDKVDLLEERKSVSKHLEEQSKSIETKLNQTSAEIESLSSQLKDTSETKQIKEAHFNTLKGQLNQLEQNLSAIGVSGDEDYVQEVSERFQKIKEGKEKSESVLNKTKEERYRFDAEIKQIQDNLTKTENRLKHARTQARPATKKWRRFRQQSQNERKFSHLLADYYANISQGKKKAESFWRKVTASQATLIAVLEKMHDTKPILDRITQITSDQPEEIDQGEVSLAIWKITQEYLNQVIPVDLQTSDPEKAQESIVEKLLNLEQNLADQEKSLRIHVQSIPSHINAEIRKQKSRIRKLNQKLETVKFGFLQSIRINIETQPKLKQFLDSLPQQLDIFTDLQNEAVSIETLMADLYEKEGAGKVKGDLLMDYRHYVKLSIEVKREGNEDYEKVTSTNLSTGESIGVGIAVLIIVLMSWEEQSTFASEAEQRGALRFLLLDESSRLDQKALYTLTDFCERLNLQLLIAAPTVERTLRGTTHHLTRGHFNGREEVIVRGRRFAGELN